METLLGAGETLCTLLILMKVLGFQASVCLLENTEKL